MRGLTELAILQNLKEEVMYHSEGKHRICSSCHGECQASGSLHDKDEKVSLIAVSGT